MPPTHDYQESVFNMALAYLKRIDSLLYLCQQASINQDIDKWVVYLRGVYREASVKLKDDEKKEIDGKPEDKIDLKKLTDNKIEDKEANFRNIYYLLNNPMFKIKYRMIILYLLDALEIKIRKKIQEKGMLLPSKDDPRMAITQR